MEKGARFHLIDSLRGLAVMSMILYHFSWDMNNLAGMDWGHTSSAYIFIWQLSICCTFILISGFCFFLAKHPLKNALLALLGGIVVTLVTIVVMPDSPIHFGILIFHSSAMLLLLPLRKLLRKIPATLGIITSLLLFMLCFDINEGSLLFGLIKLPVALYRNMFTAFWGLPSPFFFSADYYPVLPWIFLFLTGFFISSFIKKLKEPPVFLYFKIPIIEWIGKKALIIYLAHQPILYCIALLIMQIKGA